MSDPNRSHSKIEKLPEDMKKEVETKLIEGETYESISEYLAEHGEDIHPSSIGRYGRKFLKKFESVRIAKEFAKLLAEDNVDRPPTELHEANNMLMSQILMEAIIDTDMTPEERAASAKSIASLQNAQVNNEKLKIVARKQAGAVHTAMNILKNKVFKEISSSHPEIAAALIELAEQTEAEMAKIQ
ncbi:MAG: DUF3486 family protein [Lachnospiraceae bacterium]|nr:DUF3486 family protein [Lachnospiraceae bacterium]